MATKAVRTAPDIRFGIFEVDLQAGELRKSGVKLKLSGQPFQVLTILLVRHGEVVTREELQNSSGRIPLLTLNTTSTQLLTRFAKC